MDTVQLKNFVLLAQTLNFSAIAKQQFISQPALTKQIHRLEDELGVRLFHRSKHGVTLTYAGMEFYKHAVDLLDRFDKAALHMGNIQQGRTGSLEISAVLGLDSIISQSAAEFSEEYPEINLNIQSGTGSQQIHAINRQAADLYFSYAPLLELFSSLETCPLPDDRFAVFAHKREAKRLEEEGLRCLDQMPNLIEFRSEGGPFFTGLIFALRDALGLTSGNIRYYSSNATVLMAVQAGMGFAFLPAQINFGLCPDNVVKIPLTLPEATIQRAIGWNASTRNSAVLRFVEVVRRRNNA